MPEVGLIIAIKRYFMSDKGVGELQKEWKMLTDKDKKELVEAFNAHKVLGDDIVVVLKSGSQ